jgi:hypothetical protein
MIWLFGEMRKIQMTKRCPRCGGNIFLEEDCFGSYAHCLQYGYDADQENITESLEQHVLSEQDAPLTQNINEQAEQKVIPDLIQRNLVAELRQG